MIKAVRSVSKQGQRFASSLAAKLVDFWKTAV